MVSSLTLTDQLARVYREARALVLGDRAPNVDRAFALHGEFLAILASFTEEHSASISEWEATFLERTRRATIVALRHQALAIRERWSESKGRLEGTQSSLLTDLEHALQHSTAAMQLHMDGDADASRTAQVGESIRQTIARARASGAAPIPSSSPAPASDALRFPKISAVPETADAPTTSVLPMTAGGDATPSDLDPTSPLLIAPVMGDSPGPAKVAEVSPSGPPEVVRPRPHLRTFPIRTSGRLLLLTAAGFAFVTWITSALMRIDKPGPVVSVRGGNSPSARAVVAVRAPVPTPSAVRVATVFLKSEPMGARVTVGGEFHGTTPLSLQGKPGEVLTIVMQTRNRVWRGVLKVGGEDRQIVTIRLPPPRAAQTPRAQPAAALQGKQVRLEALLQEGIKLYESGWFGPAAARFRQALTIDPRTPHAYLWLGRALMRSDRQAEARQALQRVIELAQTGPQADEAAALLRKLR